MSLTQKDLAEAVVGNRLALSKLYVGAKAADTLADVADGKLVESNGDGTVSAAPVTSAQLSSLVTTKSWDQLLLDDAAAWDGGNGAQWDVIWTDYGSLQGSSQDQIYPGYLSKAESGTYSKTGTSTMLFDGTAGHSEHIIPTVAFGGMHNTKWWARWRCSIEDAGVCGAVYVRDMGGNNLWAGILYSHNQDATHIRAISDTAAISGQAGGIQLLTYDTNQHTYDMRSDGLGSYTTSLQIRVDGGEWQTLALSAAPTGTSGMRLAVYTYGIKATMDTLGIAVKTPRA